ncbi:hypothetical protein FJZ36_05530 [Candidatus Poribacteria bacterium]|nr:hypothetical protein [Candidatus Poribacteria bacterium]
MIGRTARFLLLCCMASAIHVGCGEPIPETWVARQGSVVFGVWDCPSPKIAKALLTQWLALPAPDRQTSAPVRDDTFLFSLLPADDRIQDWRTVGERQYLRPHELTAFLRRPSVEYEAFGVRGLVTAEYANVRLGPKPLLRVEVYDMGTPANAFGLYSQKRIPGGMFVPTGGGAFIGETELLSWSDRYYVFIRIYEFSDDTRDGMRAFASTITGMIGGVRDEPEWTTRYATIPSLVLHSERWFANTAQAQVSTKDPSLLVMPLDDDVEGFVSRLRIDDTRTSEAFCILFPTVPAAEDAYAALESALASLGGNEPEALSKMGDEGFRVRTNAASPAEEGSDGHQP